MNSFTGFCWTQLPKAKLFVLVLVETSDKMYCTMIYLTLDACFHSWRHFPAFQLVLPLIYRVDTHVLIRIRSWPTQQCRPHLQLSRSQVRRVSCCQINNWFPRSRAHPHLIWLDPTCGEEWLWSPLRFTFLIILDNMTTFHRFSPHYIG